MSLEKDVLYNEVTLITGVINRISNFAFIIKGWTMALTGIMLSLGSPSYIKALCLTLLIGLFWFLDAKYYQIERFYRSWYDIVVSGNRKGLLAYTLNPFIIKQTLGSQVKQIGMKECLFNKTIAPIYAILIAIICITTVLPLL